MLAFIDQYLAGFFVCLMLFVVACTLTPVPGLFCFHIAWEPKTSKPVFSIRKALLLLPTTVFPVILLVMHGIGSTPDWQIHGRKAFSYMAIADACWVFLLPFVAANYVVARAIMDRDFVSETHLPPLAIFTCLLISLYFAVGNWDREFYWCFPLSTACSYGYGLYRLLKLQTVFVLRIYHLALLIGWGISAFTTVFSAFIVSKKMVDRLPDEKPDYFVVTAASKGHPSVVGSWQDDATGCVINRQLNTFRDFEHRLIAEWPTFHKVARRVYNVVAPLVARCIVFRWQADFTYFILKLAELLVRR